MTSKSELLSKARQQADRRYTIAMEKIVRTSEEQLSAERNRRAAAGSLLSGGMWKFCGRNLTDRLEGILRARLSALLDAYELYEIPLDAEIERQVLEDITKLREAQISNANQFVSTQP